jgi:hypothetical protein
MGMIRIDTGIDEKKAIESNLMMYNVILVGTVAHRDVGDRHDILSLARTPDQTSALRLSTKLLSTDGTKASVDAYLQFPTKFLPP